MTRQTIPGPSRVAPSAGRGHERKPVVEGRRAYLGIAFGQQGALGDLRTEVRGVDIGEDVARVVACVQSAPDELVEAELLGPGDLVHAVERCMGGDACDDGRHVVALSVVGTQRHPDIAYFRAKIAQENLIKASGLPYSLVHATQFFEFFGGIADNATVGDQVSIPPVLIQPIAADDVANVVARVAAHAPVNGTHEIAGPEQFRFDEFIRRGLDARNDPRNVLADVHAPYFGAEIAERTLLPEGDAEICPTTFDDWLALVPATR